MKRGDGKRRDDNNDNRDRKPGNRRFNQDNSSSGKSRSGTRQNREGDEERRFRPKPEGIRNERYIKRERTSGAEKPERHVNRGNKKEQDDTSRKPFNKRNEEREGPSRHHGKKPRRVIARPGKYKNHQSPNDASGKVRIRLNRYVANAGICSRREADQHIKAGHVTVNGKVVKEMGTKVHPTDEVAFKGRILQRQEKIYILLNKPKDYLTTTDDPEGRKTVLELIKDATKKRVYPVGRLDRNTSGLLLLTNDGEITKKLTHPSYKVPKVYDVELDKSISQDELQQLVDGVQLSDGFESADAISFPDPENKKRVGVEIHSGKNRIVRRLFEHLGYDVKRLDRVLFAGLTKKNVKRGHWRYLTKKEINILYMMPSPQKG